MDDFFKFLGPELKAVTGDMQGIDRVVQRVKAMYEPVELVNFNVFDYGEWGGWRRYLIASSLPRGHKGRSSLKLCLL